MGPVLERRDAARAVGLVVFAAVLSVTAGAVLIARSSGRSWFPTSWDARVAPIAAEVAHLRGLDFQHPVPIRYLAPNDFQKQLGDENNPSSADRAEALREESLFRALGFIGGNVDLLRGFDTAQSSETLAFYDPDRKEIIVRGSTLDVAHQVTIAHELTHVLQDQHFNLPKLQQRASDSDSGDASAFKGLIEGDAVRIEDDYLKQLSSADRKDYDRENNAEGARIGKETASVPEIVDLLSGAPYDLGLSTVEVLQESGGNAAVNDAITGPVPSTEVFVESGDITPPVRVEQPVLPPDSVTVGTADTFGPFEMFLTLAMRIDPVRALAAADVVAGGRAVLFRSHGATCYRVAVAPTFEHSRSFLLAAVGDWARGRPRTTLDAAGDLVGFTACDPGGGAPAPSAQPLKTAVEVLSFRTGVTVAAAKSFDSGDLARCAARVFMGSPGAEKLVLAVGDRAPTAAQSAQLRELGVASGEACQADPNAHLP
ncbi:MAG TPA: hypothetical protein VIK54_19060 [Acidimicrobiia bacterium]